MRYLGIDYGEKRIGIALSDESFLMAFPEGTIENTSLPRVIKKIKTLVTEKGVLKIVIGLPVALAGHETHGSRAARNFAEILKNSFQGEIIFENEMLTTKLARAYGQKEEIDASSAALILQSYLDKIKKR